MVALRFSPLLQGIILALLYNSTTRAIYVPYTYDRMSFPPQFYTDVADAILASATYHGSTENSYDSR